jgi:hypothetical protein
MKATVHIEMHSPLTNSMGWHRRRLQKMVKSVFTCLAYTDPTGMFDVHIVTSLDQSFVFGIGTYNLDLLVEMPQEKIDRFIWFAKEVKYFHTVTLTPHPEPVTMPT